MFKPRTTRSEDRCSINAIIQVGSSKVCQPTKNITEYSNKCSVAILCVHHLPYVTLISNDNVKVINAHTYLYCITHYHSRGHYLSWFVYAD